MERKNTSIENMSIHYSSLYMANENEPLYFGRTPDMMGYEISDAFVITFDIDEDSYMAFKNRITGKEEYTSEENYPPKDIKFHLLLAYRREADLQKDIPFKAIANKLDMDMGEYEQLDILPYTNNSEFLKISAFAEEVMLRNGDMNDLIEWKMTPLYEAQENKEFEEELE